MNSNAITISEKAALKIKQLVEGLVLSEVEGKPENSGLRIKVMGGGCSGLQYKMNMDIPNERDKVFEKDGARVIVDKKSFLYLNGSTVDYSEELMSSGFKIINPHVTGTCGCGDSFRV